jgi:hypothetical protein
LGGVGVGVASDGGLGPPGDGLGTGAVGAVGSSVGSAEMRLGPTGREVGRLFGSAARRLGPTGLDGGSSVGSAEMRLGPRGAGLGVLAVVVADCGTRSAGEGLGGGGTLRAGAGLTGAGVARPVRRVWSSWSVATWLSVRGASGDPADGLAMAWVRSARLARIKSLEEARGMVTLVGNHEIVSQMRSARVSQIQTLWQRYESIAGPVYQPSVAWGDQVVRWDGLSWTRTRMPGGARGVRLKSKIPLSCAQEESLGLRREPRRRFKVMRACGRMRSQR